jgi:hypothetical protein
VVAAILIKSYILLNEVSYNIWDMPKGVAMGRFLFLAWLTFGIASSLAAYFKGRSASGFFLLGFFLGPIGLIWAMLASASEEVELKRKVAYEEQMMAKAATKKCHYCGEIVKLELDRCPICKSDQHTEASIDTSFTIE